MRPAAARLQFLGGGRMAGALVGGLVGAGALDASEIVVVEPLAARRAELEALHPGLVTSPEPSAVADVVLAVKPDVAEAACGSLRSTGVTRLLSIAAGVRAAALESWTDGAVRVVRAMPNTPALIGRGVAGVAAGSAATDDDVAWAVGILEAVGTAEVVSEDLLDAVTAVSGSGPAYLFFLAEAMREAAATLGLPPDVGARLVAGTLTGAAELLASSSEDPAELRAQVTSPGGTTAAAVAVLEDEAVRRSFVTAIRAAAARAAELGSSPD